MSLPENQDRYKTDFVSSDTNLDRFGARGEAALLTGSGRSAVAVIAAQGPGAEEALRRRFLPATAKAFAAGQLRFGRWGDDEASEEVVVAPLSDVSFEIHCHGGPAAVARILGDLRDSGVHVVDSTRWLEESAEPLAVREAMQVLAGCRTVRFAAVALDQTRGALRDWASETEQEWSDRGDDTRWLTERIDELLARARLGLRLTDSFRVVLSGPPNVGKSSLVNAILGYDRSITLDVAGTTRDLLHADTVIDGIPIRLSDTAGVHGADEPIERQGISRAIAAVEAADLVVFVGQPGLDPAPSVKTCVRVMNKADLASRSQDPDENVLRTVATTGEGVPALMQAIAENLIDSFPPAGSPVPLTNRQVDILTKIATTDPGEIHTQLRRLIDGPATSSGR